jgi:hypothetical protein
VRGGGDTPGWRELVRGGKLAVVRDGAAPSQAVASALRLSSAATAPGELEIDAFELSGERDRGKLSTGKADSTVVSNAYS